MSLLSKLSKFSTCELADALGKLGIASGNYIPDITAIPGQAGTHIAGEAYTVKMADAKSAEPSLKEHFIDTAPSGSIMVISSPKHVKSASLGGLLAVAAGKRGVVGAVIDGRCRDLAELRNSGLQVYSRGHSVLGQSPFTRPVAVNTPIVIEPQFPAGVEGDFPAVQVNPKDFVFADENGIVIVPQAIAEEVAAKAEKGTAIDDLCMQDIQKGRGVKETFAEHRGKK